ncbi:competence/damage-inducible protein A [Gordonia sp. LSe1-13]|uniref:CinA-like protein n=1 Tax=Gordonia sesuvii TaxID=3116777 RepID=A0ABU7MHM9_9ACTN|nr:competence/damage-inducible protein A [Gordonia sp. LSe1-13]
MSARAGIVVTGTEVLTGRVADRNGPWVAGRLLELGVGVAHITVCGDRPDDLRAQLRFLAAEGVDLIVTTGGLGPTADDLTVATVAEFTGRPLHLDTDLEAHIADIIGQWMKRRKADPDPGPLRAGIRKQALVPEGAQPIPPTGTAPGVVIPADVASGSPTILVLPGPPRELQAMWPTAIATAEVTDALAERDDVRQEIIRAYGLSEADLAETLRDAERDLAGFDDLEITTCLRNGELEMVTRFPDDASSAYAALATAIANRHQRHIFSTDGSTIDDQLVSALSGRTVATAESCTGGMVAARLTDRAGSSAYMVGGVVAYANETKTGQLDVPAELIATHGAVSEQVAAAMAEGAVARLGADVAVSTTGIAGPGGGSDAKPVGTVCFGIAVAGRPTSTWTRYFPGDRANVRLLSTVAAMHFLVAVVGDPS